MAPVAPAERLIHPKIQIPSPYAGALNTVRATAGKLGMALYAAGGVVRDLLLGVDVLDLDCVVEGDALALARALGAEGGARVRAHTRFGTAQLTFPDGIRLDLATARTETYQRPGALPDVSPGSIQEDLRRRDFTINALALRLSEPGAGEVMDPFGGLTDLQARLIRALYPQSFLEDPTRILRALRFAARFRFALEPGTAALVHEAVLAGSLQALTPERLRREVVLGLEEEDPVAVAIRWERYGVLDVFHPGLGVNPAQMYRCMAALRWFGALQQPEIPDRVALMLAGLLHPLPPVAAAALCADRLRLSPRRCETVEECLTDGAAIAARVPDRAPGETAEFLARFRLETLLYTAAVSENGDVEAAIGSYLRRQRHVRLLMTGDDLKAMGAAPGPAFGAALSAALAEKRNGRLPSREAERHFLAQQIGLPGSPQPPLEAAED